MLHAMFLALVRGARRRSPNAAAARPPRFALSLFSLESREVPAVFAFSAGGSLSVFGDNADNAITVSRTAAGAILVNGGAVNVIGVAPTVANTTTVAVFGLGGNDAIALDEANGALPRALMFGGAGNDTLTGGSGTDLLFGQTGDDTLLGKGGADSLFGGTGNDLLLGGTGDDQVFGEAGDDRMVWNPGEGSDLNEGGAGFDTVVNNGGNGDEVYTVAANGARVRLDRVSPAPFALDIGTSESLVVNLNGGNDSFTAGTGLAPLIKLTVDGGDGNDAITGGDGNDLLLGGNGNDTITGGRGSDVAFMGAGDDTFVWNPGDGSDLVEGQAGSDKLLFFGSNASENFDFSANGSRVRFTRDVGNVTIDMAGVERTELRALGGADNVVVGDLTGTDLTAVELSLRGPNGGGDGEVDSVTVNGTQGNDAFGAAGDAGGLRVFGLHTAVTIFDQDPALDRLTLNGLGGDDSLDARSLRADSVQLALNGGDGDDAITGSDGNDLINGGRGSDVALMGAGDDTFVWNPGDNSDVVEGQAGADTLLFNGNNASEKIDLTANGSRLRFTRDIGNVAIDANAVEAVTFNALGGADTITVNDLTGTGVTAVNLNLSGTPGGTAGDNQADTVIVTGTSGDDAITVAGSAAGTRVAGLSATVSITGVEPANDRLVVNALAGDDVIDASGLTIDGASLTANGGSGDDVIIGGAGDDTLTGGDGDDVIIGGPGNDLLDGGAGDNVLVP